MKKIGILLLLLAAAIAVAWRYRFPPQGNPRNAQLLRWDMWWWVEQAAEISATTVTVRPAIAPEYPLADVEEAAYAEENDVIWSTIYEVLPGTSLSWVRTDNDQAYPWYVEVKAGKVAMKWWSIVAGAFVIDMSSIRLQWGDPSILEQIISSTDLDISSFPQASFILQESNNGSMTGILTIKWVSKRITFPVVVVVAGDKLRIVSDFSIDRKYRGITWNSATLSPFIDLSLEWVLKKK